MAALLEVSVDVGKIERLALVKGNPAVNRETRRRACLASADWLTAGTRHDVAERLRNMIIAIDGTAASGKGTLARRIAAELGLPHLDTGLLYRAVGKAMLDGGAALDDVAVAERTARGLRSRQLADPSLRSAEAGKAASAVAIIPAVRAALKAFQVDFAHQPGGAVLDGRDIGSVIAPDADLKLWVTARPEVRARRRYLELAASDPSVSEARLLAELAARDARDAPNMVRAADAVLLDTSEMDREGVFSAALALVLDRQRAKAAG
jgi:cytidylate kinase